MSMATIACTEDVTNDIRLVICIDILCDETQRPTIIQLKPITCDAIFNSLGSSDPNFNTLRILNQPLKNLEKILQITPNLLPKAFQNREQDITPYFPVLYYGGSARGLDEGEELGPGPGVDFDFCYGCYDASCRMTDEFPARRIV